MDTIGFDPIEKGALPLLPALQKFYEVHIMNFRTKEHYENRLAKLLARGETMNEGLIRKTKRQLSKFNTQ